ncbi:hexokinase 3 [Wolffia australiana]
MASTSVVCGRSLSFAGGWDGLPRRKWRILAGIRASGVAAPPVLADLQAKCATPLPVLRRVADAMVSGMGAGLASDDAGGLPMIPSFVDSLPRGDEKGAFYALDLGGTNFRVLKVELGGRDGRVVSSALQYVQIPQELMFRTTEELFDFIASELARFVASDGGASRQLAQGQKWELGFTFSFPVRQTSIDSGILIKWTKGFAVSGTAGRDVVACLNEAMDRQGLDMRVSALVNDTVATLAGARYWDENVMVAVILGTGTNACYIERANAIPKLQGLNPSSGEMVINTEWGAFSEGLPLTEFDRDMDSASINPGEQIFEKTISGMYLGEIARRILLKMSEDNALFGDSIPEKLTSPFVLSTPSLCAMHQDNTNDLSTVGTILTEAIGAESSVNARKTVVDVCDTIVKRAGRLAGAGIVGILEKMESDSPGLVFGKRTVVAMDGGLYEHYPQYRKYIQDAVSELLGPQISKNIIIDHNKDGSGIGAALLAAANSKYGSQILN